MRPYRAGSKPIARSYAGAGLLAHIVTGKYADHLPLYRQSEIYRRQSVELSRATLGRWTGAVAVQVMPVRVPGMIIAGILVVIVKAHGNSVLYVTRVAMVPGDRGMC